MSSIIRKMKREGPFMFYDREGSLSLFSVSEQNRQNKCCLRQHGSGEVFSFDTIEGKILVCPV